MFRKRIGDQSESKIDSDKIPAKKDRDSYALNRLKIQLPLYNTLLIS